MNSDISQLTVGLFVVVKFELLELALDLFVVQDILVVRIAHKLVSSHRLTLALGWHAAHRVVFLSLIFIIQVII